MDPRDLIAEQRGRIAEIDRLLEDIVSDQARAGLEQSRRDALRIIAEAEAASHG